MGLLFLFTVLVDDLNNVSQFITMSFCLSDIFFFFFWSYCASVF